MPGSARSELNCPCCGWSTLTGCTSSVFVVAESCSLSRCRACRPRNATPASRTGIRRNQSNRFPLRGACEVREVSASFVMCSSCCIASSRVLKVSVAHDGEYSGHEEESSDGCKQQAADNRAPERGVLLATLTQPERHRDHADNHGERCHDHRPQSCRTSLERGQQAVMGIGKALIREADDQDAVCRRY